MCVDDALGLSQAGLRVADVREQHAVGRANGGAARPLFEQGLERGHRLCFAALLRQRAHERLMRLGQLGVRGECGFE